MAICLLELKLPKYQSWSSYHLKYSLSVAQLTACDTSDHMDILRHRLTPGQEWAPVSNRWSLLSGVHKLGCLERWAHHSQCTQVMRNTISSREEPSDRTVMEPTLGSECTSFPIPPTKPSVWPQGQESALLGFWGSLGLFCNCFHWPVNKAREMLCIQGFLMQQTERQSHSLLLLNRMFPANKQEETSSGQQSPSPVTVSPGPALLSPWELENTSGVKIVPAKSAAKPCSWTSCMAGVFFVLYLISQTSSKLC